jgi:hypothetical protein
MALSVTGFGIWIKTCAQVSKVMCAIFGAVNFNLISIFYVHVTVHRNKFLFCKINRCTNFSRFIIVKKLHVSGSSSAHYQEFSTAQLSSTFRMELAFHAECA